MNAITYVFKEAPVAIRNIAEADPQVIGEELAKLTTPDGRLDVHTIPDAARNPANPLHKHFSWDDKIAAAERRLDQARYLVRSIRVVSEDSNRPPMPAYYSLNHGGRAYHTISSVENSASLQVRLLEVGRRDLEAFQRRFHTMSVVCVHIAGAIAAIDEQIAKNKPAGETPPAKKKPAKPPAKKRRGK